MNEFSANTIINNEPPAYVERVHGKLAEKLTTLIVCGPYSLCKQRGLTCNAIRKGANKNN